MPDLNLATALQLFLGLGLLNVWLVRSTRPTAYRGGSSLDLKGEFQAYGLAPWVFYLVGTLKVASGVALVVGLWLPSIVLPAASVVLGLMLGALAMHAKVKDAPLKSLPAFVMFAACASLLGIGGL